MENTDYIEYIKGLVNDKLTELQGNFRYITFNDIEADADNKAYLAKYYTNWFQEVICDIIGVFLFGPSYIFAFFDLFGTVHLDIYSEEHPPNRARLNYMFKVLEGGYAPDFDYTDVWVEENVEDIAEHINALKLIADDSRISFVNIEINISVDNDIPLLAWEMVLTETLQHIEDIQHIIKWETNAYNKNQYTGDINDLAKYAENIIPIAEYPLSCKDSEPKGLSTILNVGWYVYITKIDKITEDLRKPKPTDEKEELTRERVISILQELFLKSIELSDIKYIWQDEQED